MNITKPVFEGQPSSLRSCVDESQPRDSVALPAIVELCEALQAERINYCHWKSNAALGRSATGENDLDLLVGRPDAQRFTELLYRLGYKRVQVPAEEQLPGIQDFYSYDETALRLIHIHAHFQLVIGHDLTKNYHLPIEQAYLDSATQGDLFRVPAPEFEFAVFVVRMILKHSTLDAMLMRHGNLSSSERRELEFLTTRATIEKSAAVLEQHLPCVDRALFESCARALRPGCSLWERARAGQRLQNRLSACARRPQAADVILKLWRRIELPVLYRLRLRRAGRRFANGGLLVAIIGGDGSGKTTLVKGLGKELSEEFDVLKVHMGKPSWSWCTILVRAILKAGRALGFYPFINDDTEASLDTPSPLFPGYPWLIREVCTARDRYQEYQRARRFASNGGLVICDRFPLPQIKIMDGPQVERVTGDIRPNALIRLLAALEHRYYARIALPDLLIVLRVDPEVCVQRKTDETSASVRSRSQEIWTVDWNNTPAHVIDGSQPRSEVSRDVRNLVWSHL